MQAAQDREGDDLATFMIGWHRPSFLLRNLLLDALMRAGLVEVVYIRMKHTVELLLMQDEQMIEALTPTWITLRECSSMMKKANSEWKKRSVTGRRVAGPDLLGMSA